MGMMAMVLVGKPVNASQVASFKPPAPAAKRSEALAAQLPKQAGRAVRAGHGSAAPGFSSWRL